MASYDVAGIVYLVALQAAEPAGAVPQAVHSGVRPAQRGPDVRAGAVGQLTLVYFSPQPEPFCHCNHPTHPTRALAHFSAQSEMPVMWSFVTNETLPNSSHKEVL